MAEVPASGGRKLHALTLALRGVRVMPGLVLASIPLIQLLVRRVDQVPALALVASYVVGIYLLLTVPVTVLYYLRFRYWITPREVVIQSGILNRQNRSIPIERVQNVEIRQSMLARAFGMARVQIETAGSSAAEGVLEYVSLQEAHDLRRIVREFQLRGPAGAPAAEPASGEAAPPEAAPLAAAASGAEARRLHAMPLHRVVLSGVYRFSLFYILLVFSGIQYLNVEPEQIVDWFTGGMFEPVTRAIEASPAVAILTGILLATLFSWLAGILVNVNRYHGFTLSLEGDKLHRRHGLMTVLEGTIPLRKVQAAVLRANAPMRLRGWRQLKLQTMGMDADQHGNQIALPFAREEEVLRITPDVLPFRMPEAFLPVSRLQIRRLTIRYSVMLAAGAGAAWWLVTPAAAWALAAWPLLPAIAYVQYRNHGWAFDGEHLFVRHGVLVHRVWVLPIERLQALFSFATLFQRRLRLASVLMDSAGATTYPAPVIRDLPAGDAAALMDRLHAAAQRRAGVPAPAPLPA